MKHRRLLAGVAVIAVVAILVSGILIYRKQRQIIPPAIAHQVSFSVYWPASTNAKPDKKTIKYDSQDSVFSYIANISGTSTTVTEQATPSEFTDIPNYFTALINHLNNYDTFGSTNGDVYLTLPSNTTGETAVINHNGTLFFAHAQGKLSENDWRLFFNNLKVIEN